MNNLWIGYERCSTCKAAKKCLLEKNIVFEERDIVKENPTEIEINAWIQQYQIPIDSLFNTSGILYRKLDLKSKKVNMTKQEKIKLLSSNGMLIKRPVLLLPKEIIIGFKKERYDRL